VPPFGVLAETAGGTNPYFATGAGGMLQAVLFGFGGLRITNEGLIRTNPVLPPNWKNLKITGVKYSEVKQRK
jgi:trehalose/maltose hydrolase-like predicted phosphorylase